MVVKASKNKCCGGYALIFMDCFMPVMNGIEATKRLNRMIEEIEVQPAPIIGLSAFSSEDEMTMCREAGMTEVIGKPISFENLRGKLMQYHII